MANYKEKSNQLKELRRLYKLGFLHYYSEIINLDNELKQIDKSVGTYSDRQSGNYKKLI